MTKRNTTVRAVLALAVIAVAVVAASAAAPRASAAACPPPPTPFQAFAAWGDSNGYVLTTGGSFEPGSASWALSGGASIVSDQAPDPFRGRSDSHALYLPAGGSATSACVTAPMILGIVRFWAKRAGATGGQLKVEVLVKGGVYQAGTIGAGSAWSPTPILSSNAPAYSGAVTYQVRLTAIGGGFDVDSVYFDPYHSR